MSSASNPLIRHLEQFGSVSEEEKRLLNSLLGRVREVGADQDLVTYGEQPSDCKLILEGFACRYKIVEGGKRQIMSFQIPGDICDLQGFLLGTMDHAIGTLTPCKVALIPHTAILDLTDTHPRLGRALWRSTLIDAAVFREWMVGIGRRSAATRVAHLLCEMMLRLEAVGLTLGHSFDLPVSQAVLGDALGLSTVHINRTLQELREAGSMSQRGTRVTIKDWEGLKRLGDFDPIYLHQGRRSDIDQHLKRSKDGDLQPGAR